MILANVIFPVFTAPYIAFFLFPVAATAAILSEIIVFKKRYQKLSWMRATGVALFANLISWFAGIILGHFLPSGLVPQVTGSGEEQLTRLTLGPNYYLLMWIGFAVAFVLSILIEFYVWKIFQLKSPLSKLFKTTTLAHVTSYALLIGIAYMCIKNNWW